MGIITKETHYIPDTKCISEAIRELAFENSCEKFTALIEGLLHSLSNRDSIKFSEKEIKVAMAAYAGMSNLYLIKSEYEVEKKYIDLIFFPRDRNSGLDILLFELKYIKKKDASEEKVDEMLYEAVKQLKEYRSAEEFLPAASGRHGSGQKITCWAIVFAGETCVRRVRVPTPATE
jgi:hypothetical protein